MSKSNEWIPLSEADQMFEYSNGAVVNHLSLPSGTDTERILLHASRVERLGRLAGAKQTHLLLHDTHSPDELDGFDADVSPGGVAVAKGLKKNDKKTKPEVSFDDTNHPLNTFGVDGPPMRLSGIRQQIYKADALALYLDRTAVKEKVRATRGNERDLLDARAWSKVLNQEIKEGMVDAAIARYWSIGNTDGVIDTGLDIFIKTLVINDIINGDYILPALVVTFSSIRRAAQLNRVLAGQVPISDFNPSIFSSLRIDRIVATSIASKIGKVVCYQK